MSVDYKSDYIGISVGALAGALIGVVAAVGMSVDYKSDYIGISVGALAGALIGVVAASWIVPNLHGGSNYRCGDRRGHRSLPGVHDANPMKYLAAVRDVVAIALLIVLTVLLWDARAGLQATTSDLATTQQQLRATLLDVSRFTQDATGVTAAIRHTLKASEQSDELVAANSAAATKQAAATLASLDDLVRHTDSQINSQVLPQLTTAIHDQNANLTAVSQRLNASLEKLAADEKDLQPILANSAQASAAAAKLTADPAIPDALKNLDQASAGMAATAKNAADASHDLAEAIHRETRPVSFTVKVASWIVNNAAKAGSMLAGFVK